MLIAYTDEHRLHAPDVIGARGMLVPNLETPARADALAQALRGAGHRFVEPHDFGRWAIAAVHTDDYLAFLETAYERWKTLAPRASHLVFAHAFPHHGGRARPSSIQGQVGYYLSGGSCPMDAGTWRAAVRSAHCALEASEAVRLGAREAYALCRPPGHHAYADYAGGFCFLNNVAIATDHLTRTMGRAAILDIDVHHGNGTQGIFYERDDVHFVSLHSDPNTCYPFYSGYASERGAGRGAGHTLNLPLAPATSDAGFLAALDDGLASIRAYDPAVLLVSLGFDAFAGDPSADLAVTTEGFRVAGRRIGAIARPVVLVQEGGYVVEKLGENVLAFLDGFMGERR